MITVGLLSKGDQQEQICHDSENYSQLFPGVMTKDTLLIVIDTGLHYYTSIYVITNWDHQ